MSDRVREGFTRREALGAIALGAAAVLSGCAGGLVAQSKADTKPPTGGSSMKALAGTNQVVPLPFKASSLNGLSERMITSHHENNYAGAVKNLNRVEQELTRVSADTPPFVVAALRDKELTFRNSKTLHEAYFGNLGGSGKRGGKVEAAISDAYGTSARWEEHFRMTGLGLGGGSGWVVLALELDGGALRTVASGNHTQSLETAVPLLVMDMYEHSYQMDFGAAVPRYIDAFFANIRWEEVDARLDRALRASALLSS